MIFKRIKCIKKIFVLMFFYLNTSKKLKYSSIHHFYSQTHTHNTATILFKIEKFVSGAHGIKKIDLVFKNHVWSCSVVCSQVDYQYTELISTAFPTI